MLGKMRVLYLDPHPTQGFSVVRRETHLPDSYFISTRQRDPRNLDNAIKEVLRALRLDIGDFYVKSKDFGNTYIRLNVQKIYFNFETPRGYDL